MGKWRFPNAVSHDMLVVQNGVLDLIDSDKVNWILTVDKQYIVASAKNEIQVHQERVSWYPIVWFESHIPRHAFICWLVYKGRLLTRSKLKQWWCINHDVCIMCNNGSEDINHLFFWTELLNRNEVYKQALSWDEESTRCLGETKGNTFRARIRKMSTAVRVYLIWQERNNMIFKQEWRDWKSVLKRIKDIIQKAIWQWRSKRDVES